MSIQARQRRQAEVPSRPGQTRRIEPEYKRQGTLQYLAVWDVRGLIMGRCEAKTGNVSFGRLLDKVLDRSPYREAERLFCVVDNGSSHRGDASIRRAKKSDPRIVLVHTPVHASWLNQVEVYFSIIQRKVLTPNDFVDLDEVRTRLALYEELTNRTPKPFAWKFTRQKMLVWLQRAAPHFSATQTAKAEGQSSYDVICKTDHEDQREAALELLASGRPRNRLELPSAAARTHVRQYLQQDRVS